MPDKQEILKLEREFWKTMAAGDYKKSAAMLAPHAASVSPMSVTSFTPDEYVEMGKASPYTFVNWSMSEEDMIFPTADTAVCTYRVTQTLKKDGLSETSESMDSSVWARAGGSWKCILHTQSPVAEMRR